MLALPLQNCIPSVLTLLEMKFLYIQPDPFVRVKWLLTAPLFFKGHFYDQVYYNILSVEGSIATGWVIVDGMITQ